jgi:IclR family transcriptional regulator, pca regulon regulatory protein
VTRGAPSAAASRTPRPERHFVQSLDRGLAVIRALKEPGVGLTLSDVARETGLARAVARRFLLTLQDLGYVRADDRRFTLTPRVLELGYSFLSSLTLPEIAQPHLRDLVGRVHESSSVSVLDGTDVVYVAREPTRRIMTVHIAVGTRFPAYATSMGRVLLAGLEASALADFLAVAQLRALTPATLIDPEALTAEIARVRERGWALVDQELEAGLRSIAVPIRDAHGAVQAAVNLSAHASRTSVQALREELLPQLLATAMAIGRDLAAGQP